MYSIQQTLDGGYILGGYSDSDISGDKTENSIGTNSDEDYWVVKLDSAGNIQWQNTIGGDRVDHLNTIQQTTDGGYIIGGSSTSGFSGSWDPNDKQVKPKGITDNRYINSEIEIELEYLIRFQNTGNDTAFTIIIQDTLDLDHLDIGTLSVGASSHENEFRVFGPGILEWRFDNILLPDSNVNEPESHGFVKYKLQQKSGNPDDTIINNRAAIGCYILLYTLISMSLLLRIMPGWR